MGERRKIAEVKTMAFGMNKDFRLKDYNRSTAGGYTVKISIWHLVDDVITKIVDEASCTAVVSGSDTIVTYVPANAAVFTVVGDYNAEIIFTKAGYDEPCKTVAWRVNPSSRS